jgi:hypothetical protein
METYPISESMRNEEYNTIRHILQANKYSPTIL